MKPRALLLRVAAVAEGDEEAALAAVLALALHDGLERVDRGPDISVLQPIAPIPGYGNLYPECAPAE